MDSSRHRLVKRLFGEVCDLPEAQRSGKLSELTEDKEIIEFVERLLRQTDTDHPRVSQPVLRMMSSVAGDEVEVGETLGAWRLVSEIGQGGMGTVYRAQRSDGHFEQEAAVKLLHGIPSAKSLEYLARERQILATLTHPNIARLYDGGTTPHGQPYLVMEYVEGTAIDRYVRDKRLPVKDLLRLMIDVCGAVSFAHQRLIVHCDIKPSNILVTTSGRPVLLDFGIARLLDGDTRNEHTPDTPLTEPSSKLTLARAFTPQYASPEQRMGHALTTATDVYSLGRMLRELLLSNNASAPPQELDLELFAIAGKAAHDDIAMRYLTASGLAADLTRFLNNLPLLALPRTGTYVARKFTQRNWPWLVAASVFILTIVTAAQRIVAERDRAQIAEQQALKERDATQAARTEAERERDRVAMAERDTAKQRDRAQSAEAAAVAERDRAKDSERLALSERNRATQAEAGARQTSDFLVSVFGGSNPRAAMGDVPASVLLDEAEKRLDQDMQGQPAVRARLYSTLGTVQRGMGAFVKAERLHSRAVAIDKETQLPTKDVTAKVPASKETSFGPSKAAYEQMKSQGLSLAEKLYSQANDLYVNGKAFAAMDAAREALQLREKYAAPDSLQIGLSLSQIGQLLLPQFRFEESTPYLEKGLALIEKASPDSDDVAYALANVAWQQYLLRDFVRAEASARRALAMRIKQGASAETPYAIKQREDLAEIIEGAGRIEEAEALRIQNVASRIALHGRDNIRVALGLNRFGSMLVRLDRVTEAIEKYKESLGIIVRTASTESPHYRTVNAGLGTAYLRIGDDVAAIAALQLAVDETRKAERAVLPLFRQAQYLQMLAQALAQNQRTDEANERLAEARVIATKCYDRKTIDAPAAMVMLTEMATATGDFDEAVLRMAQLNPLLSGLTLPAKLSAQLARARALIAENRRNIPEALREHELAEHYWQIHYGNNNSVAWLEKLPRAQLLATLNNAEENTQSRQLAKLILANVADKKLSDGAAIARLQQLQQLPGR